MADFLLKRTDVMGQQNSIFKERKTCKRKKKTSTQSSIYPVVWRLPSPTAIGLEISLFSDPFRPRRNNASVLLTTLCCFTILDLFP